MHEVIRRGQDRTRERLVQRERARDYDATMTRNIHAHIDAIDFERCQQTRDAMVRQFEAAMATDRRLERERAQQQLIQAQETLRRLG